MAKKGNDGAINLVHLAKIKAFVRNKDRNARIIMTNSIFGFLIKLIAKNISPALENKKKNGPKA